MAIFLDGWILVVGGIASVRVGFNGAPPSSFNDKEFCYCMIWLEEMVSIAKLLAYSNGYFYFSFKMVRSFSEVEKAPAPMVKRYLIR